MDDASNGQVFAVLTLRVRSKFQPPDGLGNATPAKFSADPASMVSKSFDIRVFVPDLVLDGFGKIGKGFDGGFTSSFLKSDHSWAFQVGGRGG
jgi:hypothetical protein